jgi:Ca-activated chloride channel family protein
MTFTHPWVLLFLIVPALLIVVPPRRVFGLVMPMDNMEHRRHPLLSRVLGAMDRVPALVLAAALMLLAGPQMLKQPGQTRTLTNIQFAMDVSGSMNAEDRYDMASTAIKDFVSARKGDAFGLTLFGSHQIRWVPLTTDHQALINAMPFADPANQPPHMGGTMINAAILYCRDNMVYEAQPGDRMIIVVSDGQSGDALDCLDELREAGITLFYVHVGSDDMTPELTDICLESGGQAFVTRDAQSLKSVFAHIDRMKPAEFAPAGTVPMDHFWPFALAALCALGVHMVGLLGVRYTPW